MSSAWPRCARPQPKMALSASCKVSLQNTLYRKDNANECICTATSFFCHWNAQRVGSPAGARDIAGARQRQRDAAVLVADKNPAQGFWELCDGAQPAGARGVGGSGRGSRPAGGASQGPVDLQG